MGPWTLHKSLGKGVSGRVFLASNSRNEVVALKTIERNSRTAPSVDIEISILRELTKLARERDEEMRIVRPREVLYSKDAAQDSTAGGFEVVGLVLEPMTPQTFEHFVGNGMKGYVPRSSERLSVFS